MQTIIIKKGGDVENPKTHIVTFTHQIDENLLKSAINMIASKNENVDFQEVIKYLDGQFNGIWNYQEINEISTFYY